MVIDATEVVGMKLVTLINEGTIVAINYTMTRRFPTREVHMIYDSSATATRATPSPPFIQPPSPPSINLRNPKVSPKRLPALALTFLPLKPSSRQIQTVLEAKVATNVKSESVDRPSTELAREAERVIAISSANAEVNIGVEGLVGMVISRPSLNGKRSTRRPRTRSGDSCRTLWMELASVFWQADVESVILYGGNTRVWFVQTVVRNAVRSAKLATTFDADKVCVLFTAFYGASTHAVVKLTILHSESGSASIIEAEVVGTVKDTSSTGKIESVFSGHFLGALDTDSNTVSASEGTKVEGELKKPVEKLQSSEITPSLEPVITKPTSLEEKKAGRERLISNAAASTKHEREEGFNGVEGFPYRFRCLPSGLGESPSNGFSIAGKRAKIKEAIHGSVNPTLMQTPKKSGPGETRSGQLLKDLQHFISDLKGGHEMLAPMPESAKKQIEDVELLMVENGTYLNEWVDQDELAWDEAAEYGWATYEEEAGSESCEADDDEYVERGQGTGDSQGGDLR
ncbi:hypothetical protein RSOLAG22IIIB_11166 [Rhizoctonia solani]|uniref:Uncharacterized protein n=1 Tax=Rhizoctonia solani TaxID=456999 RepID=A0A0K6G7M7_9AGAM|nr:hypothetical protein RSOLAG22IIIB_11166 [Rhizoctonia solani]